ncbi:hypothetical protein OC846_005968 [Tilletia horrida]|uniref:DUF7918 domain-containing protein n=1 Tax=Tilletia horrida TaxID=155126 RepID=A0AAN6GM23_9BASI|nr:hypothetical protein OC846_005968 [Tilletia horrida]
MLDGRGRPRTLYGTKKDRRTVECYVGAKEGEAFQVQVEGRPAANSCHEASFYVGEHCVSQISLGWGPFDHTASDCRVSAHDVCSLLFAKLTTTDNPDNGIRDAEEVARLGSIRMSVQRLVDVREELTPEEPSEDEDDDDEDAEELLPSHTIYEKAQKVGAIGFAAGPKRTRKMEAKYHLCGTPDPAFEQIDFIFHCMTRVGLQVKNLIPGKRRQKGGQSQYSTRMPPDMQKIKKEHGERKRRRREREARDHERDDTDAEKAALKRKLQKLKERKAELQRQEGSSSRAKVEPVAFDFTQGGTAHEPILVE